MRERQLSGLDRLLSGANNFLRTVAAPAGSPARPYPAKDVDEAELSDADRRHAAGLMRVNHAGEIAAQGLYQGHAAVAREGSVESHIHQAAQEEFDHLAWCEQRLKELKSDRSRLSPFWYAGAFAMGAASGVLGDKWSLGFIAATEQQVVEHLESHYERLPKDDKRSRAIIRQMRVEEEEHEHDAIDAGAAELPAGIKKLMTITSKVMTRTAYWI
ncbi:MAG: 2-polyprenyl-3-methyl-6-methoxy-1,4-benzoquinone monooxygenase [Woeseiaceae bacterium]|nr:2-polyprenyl-3-methyl-6-methoxy-1,4-benzoquinone monooxygenase [Woeseiaceae bacterium]